MRNGPAGREGEEEDGGGLCWSRPKRAQIHRKTGLMLSTAPGTAAFPHCGDEAASVRPPVRSPRPPLGPAPQATLPPSRCHGNHPPKAAHCAGAERGRLSAHAPPTPSLRTGRAVAVEMASPEAGEGALPPP